MFEINSGRWAELYRTIFGQLGPAVGVDDKIVAAVVMALDRPEFAFTRSEMLFKTPQLTAAAGGAGTRSCVGIFNRQTRSLVVITGVNNASAFGCIARAQRLPDAVIETGIVAESPVIGLIDQRWLKDPGGAGTASAARLFSRVAAGAPGVVVDFVGGSIQVRTGARNGLPFAILPPQSYFYLETGADQQAVTASFEGYSVPLSHTDRG